MTAPRSWLKSLRNRLLCGPATRPVLAPKARLALTPLEDRAVPATGWVNAIGGPGDDRAWGVAADAAGNAYVVGTFTGTVDFDPGAGEAIRTSAGGSDAYVAKYRTDGTLDWVQRLGGSGADTPLSVGVGSDGAVWVTGTFAGTAGFGAQTLTTFAKSDDMFVTKLDGATGAVQKALQVGSLAAGTSSTSGDARALVVDAAGSVYVTGMFTDTVDFDPNPSSQYNLTALGTDARDAFVLKLDSDGGFAWARRMGGPENIDQGQAIVAAPGGGVYVSGRLNSRGDFGDTVFTDGSVGAFVTRLDGTGNFLWAKRITAETGEGFANGLAADASGNVYVTGTTSHGGDFDPSAGTAPLPSGPYVASLDSAGNYRWASNLGNQSTNAWGRAVEVGADGYLYVVGSSSGGDFDAGPGTAYLTVAGGLDAFLTKLDSAGNLLGLWHAGGAGWDDALGLSVYQNPETNATEVLLAGRFTDTARFDTGTEFADRTSAGLTDGYLMRLTPGPGAIMGRVIRDLGTEGPIAATGLTVYLDANGNGLLDAGEQTAVTGAHGQYEFRHLADGVHTVRLLADGWTQVAPAAGGGHSATLSGGQFVTERDFVVSAPTKTVTFASTTAKNIPTSGTVTSTITITDTRSILDLNVTLNVSHNRLSDLRVALIGPDGTRVYLVYQGRAAGAHFTSTRFSDEATRTLAGGAAPYTGTFRPAEGLTAFDGKSLTGTWTLEIRDGVTGTGGKLNGWSLAAVVDAVNSPPQAADDTATTTAGTPVTVAVLANDFDADGDPLTVTAVTQPEVGSVVVNADGTVTYLPPDSTFTGTVTFWYTIDDGNGGTSTAKVTVTIQSSGGGKGKPSK